jgi:hypothetical protein
LRQIAREAPKRTEADGSTFRENLKETARIRADLNPNTALWTTLSGFESLPPSQPSLADVLHGMRQPSCARAADTAPAAVVDWASAARCSEMPAIRAAESADGASYVVARWIAVTSEGVDKSRSNAPHIGQQWHVSRHRIVQEFRKRTLGSNTTYASAATVSGLRARTTV